MGLHRFPLREVGALLDAEAVHPGRSARSHQRTMAATLAQPGSGRAASSVPGNTPPHDPTRRGSFGSSGLYRWISFRCSSRANTEQGRPIWVARDRRAPWTQLWPQLRRLS